MRRQPFSTESLDLTTGEPGPLQAVAVRLMEAWALLPNAAAEASVRRDDGLAFHLSLIEAALSLPEVDRAPRRRARRSAAAV